MTISKFLSVFFCFFLFLGMISAVSLNEQGDFRVELSAMKAQSVNTHIYSTFNVVVENNLQDVQSFSLDVPELKGWDVIVEPQTFVLSSGQKKKVSLVFRANSEFEYSDSIRSPDEIKISQKNTYKGDFTFPVVLKGKEEEVSFALEVEVFPSESLPQNYGLKFSESFVSPQKALRYSISSKNVVDSSPVIVEVFLGSEKLSSFNTFFSSQVSYRIFEEQIPSTIKPGEYLAKITIKSYKDDSSFIQWYKEGSIKVEPYKELVYDREVLAEFLGTSVIYKVENKGNLPDVFSTELPINWWSSLFFFSEEEIIEKEGVSFMQGKLNQGEKKEFSYSFNYFSLLLVLVFIFTLVAYFVYRKTSNPLSCETKLYDIKKVKHEGVKSFKVQIGFENVKVDEIEKLRIIFRMPSYLSVKDNSFLLTEPKQVLKGSTQYKLMWEFKRFEKGDERILGFTLVNSRGILGDVRLEDLEFEVKLAGKVKKYYKGFPVIKG